MTAPTGQEDWKLLVQTWQRYTTTVFYTSSCVLQEGDGEEDEHHVLAQIAPRAALEM